MDVPQLERQPEQSQDQERFEQPWEYRNRNQYLLYANQNDSEGNDKDSSEAEEEESEEESEDDEDDSSEENSKNENSA